ncbi:MAG: PD-(D/E)XK nuclease family protein [Paraprevotella sp.]|nr:PD-(D/E)XK nuclease family protein [Paraprevotella sp.]
MQTFIQLIAQDLIRRFGTNLRDVTVVFPNKRAGLFMNQQLAAAVDRPIWAPRYRTISELFDELSDFTRCDDILSVCMLHEVYSRLVPSPEPLDRIYGWGEIMLADFDEMDKHLADPHKLFSNILSIKELDDSSSLTPRQEEALKRFFEGFSIEGNSRLKEKFLALWNKMDEIYTSFNKRLREKGLLYEGALYKDVIEHLNERFLRMPTGTTYIFVGFNVLNEVEKTLFHHLHEQHRALFYWDYDVMYIGKESRFEAGTFIRQNLKEFPNALSEECYNNLSHPPRIEFIATTSENAQARYIPQWLSTELTQPEQDTAIVLCNESLLQPVLHSLPDSTSSHPVKHANITMGFPMTDTPIYSVINALLSLQTEGYDRDRRCFRTEQEKLVRSHPYVSLLSEKDIFVPHTGNQALLTYVRTLLEQLASVSGQNKTDIDEVHSQLYNEALYRAYQVICRFIHLAETQILDIQSGTLRRLLRNVLSATTIPFHGEPAVGLQVMGVLETRNLNFRHILILSVNEGMLPKAANDTSFIPYHLREVFGLTTIQHKVAVYAFYFYRLLQRTESITFMYNIATDGLNKNEMSRFLRQLLAETDFPIEMKILQAGQAVPTTIELEVKKTPEIMNILLHNYAYGEPDSRPLSPSALNAYLDCPLKFYYQQIARIRKPKDPQNGLDNALFGTIFHEAAEGVYQKLTERNSIIRKQDIERLLEGGESALLPFVEASFLKNFFNNQPESVFYNGQLLVARKVMVTYLRQLLTHDSRMELIILQEMEQEHYQNINVTSGNCNVNINIGGKIDRMDIITMTDPTTGREVETLRIVDYKTGGYPEKAGSMEQLVQPSERRPEYIFQIFLYAWVMSEEQHRPISPALFFVHKSNAEDYDPVISYNRERVTDFNRLKDEFKTILQTVLNELFDPKIPFRQTSLPKICSYCDYKILCGK